MFKIVHPFFLITCYLTGAQAFCQPFSMGVKVGIQSFRNAGEVAQAGPFAVITSPDAGFDELSFHLMGRYDIRRFYVQGEFRYSKTHVGYTLKNIDYNNPDYKEFKPFDVLTYSDDVRRYDIPVTIGYKLLKHLRINGGLIPSFSSQPPRRTPYYSGTTIDMVDDITRSYIRTQLYASVGVGVDFGRFSVDFTHERSVTPMSRTLIWRDEVSSFIRTSRRSFIMLGYRFYPFPKVRKR